MRLRAALTPARIGEREPAPIEQVGVALVTEQDDDAERGRHVSFATGETPSVVVSNTDGRAKLIGTPSLRIDVY